MGIKYLKHNQIDKTLWDQCVSTAPNGLIYGMSWYLDRVCLSWDALVMGNYDAVMPLPWKKKFGLKYMYQPWFAQQLGIFALDPAVIKTDDFVEAIPRNFRRREISFNFMNRFESIKTLQRYNYVLSLSSDHQTLLRAFSENTIRNIKKATKQGYAITREIGAEEFMNLMWSEIGYLLNEKHRFIIKNLIEFLVQNNYAGPVGIKNNKNELLGAVFFVRFQSRLIYLFSASNQKGKENRVMFQIVDEIIRENCGKPLLLDFEGSMIDGIARFYKGFGSNKEIYHCINKKMLGYF
jgi:ribulose bisphosphate carboxylase small subunit